MREAIRLSVEKMRESQGGPFGAVVVRGDEVVGRGWSRVTSTNDPTAHAEVVAIRDACGRLGRFHLEGCELYSSCEPCPMCLAATYWARIARVWFGCGRDDAAAIGFADARIYAEIARDPTERELPAAQILRDEAIAAFDEWRAKRDRIPY